MPVVNVDTLRLRKMIPKVKLEKALDMLPFIALDIEGTEGNIVRVEYNPNRPDFSSDYGIIRALKGLLEIETGTPKFKISGRSGLSVKVGKSVNKVRPHIVALVARSGKLDDETIKQIIAMQEDLHNGVGRKRKKASIGIHNLDAISFPVYYQLNTGEHEFVPLGESSKYTLKKILDETETGRQYSHILRDIDYYGYPIITDSKGNTLSFPPIINGDTTKVDTTAKNLFVEVTATDKKAAQDILAVIAVTLYDAGFDIQTVSIQYPGKKEVTPEMKPRLISVQQKYVNELIGLDLSTVEIIKCLKRSRIDAKKQGGNIVCTIPRYRTDIFGPVDIVEEVAIGFGIFNLEPIFPASATAGRRSQFSVYSDAVRETLAGLGLLESVNFSLVGRQAQYGMVGRKEENVLAVDETKSSEHEVLRDSLVPSLLLSLSHNIHEEYPQKMFEIGKVFSKSEKVTEHWSVAAVIAHAGADYTEIKSVAQAMLKLCFGKDVVTKPKHHQFFIEGRSASVSVDGKGVGIIGEVAPLLVDNFKLRVPVSAFEINLTSLVSK